MPDPAAPEAVLREKNVALPEASESLTSFCGSIAPQAKRFAMSMVRRWCEAEELVQESFFRMAKAESSDAAKFQSCPGMRKSYLFTTIRNLAVDQLRSQNRRAFESYDLDNLGTLRTSEPEQQRRLHSLESAVEETLESMPTNWADALKLKLNGELSYAEIATVLSATPGQVRGWIFRARKLIAAQLEKQGLLETTSE